MPDHKYRWMFRYTVSGVISVIAQFSVLSFLVEIARMDPTVSSGLGFLVGCLVNYFMLYYWAFQSNGNHFLVVCKYILVAFSTLFLNLILFYILTEVLGIWYLFSQTAATGWVAIFNMYINKVFTFKRNGEELPKNGEV